MAAQLPSDPHELAVDAQTYVHALAVSLAHAGLDKQSVDQLQQFAQVLAQLAKQLAQAPLPQQQAPRDFADAAGQTQQMMQQHAAQQQMPQGR